MSLTVHVGGGEPQRQTPRHRASLATVWVACTEATQRLELLALGEVDVRRRAHARLMAAFARTWAARLLARMSTLGRGPLPLARDTSPGTLEEEFAHVLRVASVMKDVAERCTRGGDVPSAHSLLLSAYEARQQAAALLGEVRP